MGCTSSNTATKDPKAPATDAAPAEGTAAPAEGTAAPAEGGAAPVEEAPKEE